ncbi:ATP-binding cassette domain-containing protein [Undibacterium sp. LX40W]|uniref:ATP-binding cassette domain-containing protein n=1 Tax=Undibacterium nitidum TaxID=2762298 RepID=A0A923KL65_9BURK|nr:MULTISPECIES: ATP-binding cassette domain-containing protein [Undibacterium]MBC3881505.1 ATP-binding cassette domain-containing protein [Undibacterium nitidum]MBC3891713.1 ATP-binding cassette domain-containing protein [Undibacterium sp. LX40W]
MSVLLSIKKLRKSFGDQALLEMDNFQLEQASAYVLTGVNGVGKTVLMRILAGLELADIEHAEWCGQALTWNRYPAHLRAEIVYVHQHPIMFQMSVADNISYGLRLRSLPRAEVQKKTEEALAWTGLQAIRDRFPQGLSGGEKQKIALARAKVLEPRLLLLDEPTSNLDGIAREQVIALIPDLINEGKTVLMACHDRDLIHLPQTQHLKLRAGKIEVRDNSD